jgi:hypothetical protein
MGEREELFPLNVGRALLLVANVIELEPIPYEAFCCVYTYCIDPSSECFRSWTSPAAARHASQRARGAQGAQAQG